MAATRMTVAEAVLLLMQADPLEEIDFEVVAKVTVTPVVKDDEPKKVVRKSVFEVGRVNLDEVVTGNLVYFDYENPGKGPATRVGVVLEDNWDSFLLYDLTVDGVRRFQHDYIEDIFLLS